MPEVVSSPDKGISTRLIWIKATAFATTTIVTSLRTTIKIGDAYYDIEVSKIPYLSSFVDFQATSQPQSTDFVHGPIPLFDIALKGIESGYRQCFPPEFLNIILSARLSGFLA